MIRCFPELDEAVEAAPYDSSERFDPVEERLTSFVALSASSDTVGNAVPLGSGDELLEDEEAGDVVVVLESVVSVDADLAGVSGTALSADILVGSDPRRGRPVRAGTTS